MTDLARGMRSRFPDTFPSGDGLINWQRAVARGFGVPGLAAMFGVEEGTARLYFDNVFAEFVE